MKVLNYTFVVAITGLLCTGSAFAQTGQVTASVDQTSFAYDSYYAVGEDDVASHSDTPAPKPTTVAADCGCAANGGCASNGGCDSGCGCSSCGVPGVCDCPCGTELDCGDPWRLQKCDNCQKITYGGWISAGITGNSHGNSSSVGNSQLGFNNDPNFQMNELWFYMERLADTGGCGWDYGFRVDVMAGSNGPDTQAFGQIAGWDNDWDWGGPANQYGAALPQAYAVLAYNDLSVKLGHFFTIIGYEVIPSIGNFFYSHAYTMYYGEPFTHTGFLAEYAWTDQISISGGWVNGWDQAFHNPNDASLFLGGITWTSCDENTSLAYAVNFGDWGDGTIFYAGTPNATATNAGDIYNHSIVLSHQFGCGWTYVLQGDLGINSNIPVANQVNGQETTEWYGINQYLLKQINCCWAYGFRFEWFRDDDGVRVDRAGAGASQASYYAITGGINWSPTANLRIRPEVRYDWQGGAGGPRFDPVAGAYRKNDVLTFGVDGIWTF